MRSLMPCNLCCSCLICVMREFTQVIKILWLEGPSFSKWPNQLPQHFVFLFLAIVYHLLSWKRLGLQFSLKNSCTLLSNRFLDLCGLVNVCSAILKESHPWLERQGKVARVYKGAGYSQSSKQSEAGGIDQSGWKQPI